MRQDTEDMNPYQSKIETMSLRMGPKFEIRIYPLHTIYQQEPMLSSAFQAKADTSLKIVSTALSASCNPLEAAKLPGHQAAIRIQIQIDIQLGRKI